MADTKSDEAIVRSVAESIASISTITDRKLLARWRLIHLCQYLLTHPAGQRASAVRQVLSEIAESADESDRIRSVGEAWDQIGRGKAIGARALPRVPRETRPAILERIRELEPSPLELAGALDDVREELDRRDTGPRGALTGALDYRIEQLVLLAEGSETTAEERQRAVGALRYVRQVNDVVPDDLGIVGLLDDDFAVRVVLNELGSTTIEHWAEKIAQLWDDLPFLQGLDLSGEDGPTTRTWLDRACSYLAYNHVLAGGDEILAFLLPSVRCEPVHLLLTLVGLTILDDLTMGTERAELVPGETYEIDGRIVATFEGLSDDERTPGWLRLRFADGVLIRPPAMSTRMTSASGTEVSRMKLLPDQDDPIQRFLGWPEAIGAGRVPGRVVWVTSRDSARQLLGDTSSNGVHLMKDGLVRFLRTQVKSDDPTGGLILIAPNLRVVRDLRDEGLEISAIVVDGYQRLRRGRDDLAFLRLGKNKPPVLLWDNSGYQPPAAETSFTSVRAVTATKDDLELFLDLEPTRPERQHDELVSLRSALAGPALRLVEVEATDLESELITLASDFWERTKSVSDIPDYWLYNLWRFAKRLRILVLNTPALWVDISKAIEQWAEGLDEHWDLLRDDAASKLAQVRAAQERLVARVSSVTDPQNSKANALEHSALDAGQVVVPGAFQLPLVVQFLNGLDRHELIGRALRDADTCCESVVAGWSGFEFARQLTARTPTGLIIVGTKQDKERWGKALESSAYADSILEDVGGVTRREPPPTSPTIPELTVDDAAFEIPPCLVDSAGPEQARLEDCVLIWFANLADGKILNAQSKVIVDDNESVGEKKALALLPGDRALLSPGHRLLSPADEFTEAVVDAVRESRAKLVDQGMKWRQALAVYRDKEGISMQGLRDRLSAHGVERESMTVEGWLNLARPHPIGPLHLDREIKAIQKLTWKHSSWSWKTVASACRELRVVRQAASHALLRVWGGQETTLDVDTVWLKELAAKLKARVLVCEVEEIARVKARRGMVGWSVSPELAERLFADEGADES